MDPALVNMTLNEILIKVHEPDDQIYMGNIGQLYRKKADDIVIEISHELAEVLYYRAGKNQYCPAYFGVPRNTLYGYPMEYTRMLKDDQFRICYQFSGAPKKEEG